MYSVDHHLCECKYTWQGKRVSVWEDHEFEDARNALNARRKQLKSMGLGNRPNRSVGVSVEEEAVLWEKGVLGCSTPFSIIFTIWYQFTLIMGLRG